MRVDIEGVFDKLHKNGINFYTGVPDSLLKDFCSFIETDKEENEHVITANEGNAIGVAAGRYLATGMPACVYMQNSGFGNAINPLLSLADPSVFGIPMLILVGWRGEPDSSDEVQHRKQGRIMKELLHALDIPYFHALKPSDFLETLQSAINTTITESRPVVVLVSKDTFSAEVPLKENLDDYPMSRSRAIEVLLENLPEESFTVSSTGFITRELFDIRTRTSNKFRNDFMMVGSMGHASSIALGLAVSQPQKRIVCIDGDGAALMHLGAMPVNADIQNKDFLHIVINNGVHGSVGNQPTVAKKIDLSGIAKSCGYSVTTKVKDEVGLIHELRRFATLNGTKFLEILVNTDCDENLKRPSITPAENKLIFMEAIRDGSN
jgi:phosphonopyruvate decarboxylase